MTVERSKADGFQVAAIRGEVDIATAPQLREELEAIDSADALVVSLEDCQYCDSSGLSVFISQQRARDGRLVLVVPPAGSVQRLFQVAGLADAFAIVGTLAEAAPRMRAVLSEAKPDGAPT